MRLAPLLKPLLAVKAGPPHRPPQWATPPIRPGWRRRIQNAYIRGERPIVITPGTYMLTHVGGAQIPLTHWHDAVLSAYKVTLIIDNKLTRTGCFSWTTAPM